MVQVSEIRINYLNSPIGIENIEQIGWKIQSDKRNVIQKTYEFQIAENETFDSILYGSGIVESEESAHIDGAEVNALLSSSKKYYIRVRVETNCEKSDIEKSRWTVGSFVTALCHNQEWKAHFITIETEDNWKESKGSYLRKEIKLEKPIRAAYAYTTALGLYKYGAMVTV